MNLVYHDDNHGPTIRDDGILQLKEDDQGIKDWLSLSEVLEKLDTIEDTPRKHRTPEMIKNFLDVAISPQLKKFWEEEFDNPKLYQATGVSILKSAAILWLITQNPNTSCIIESGAAPLRLSWWERDKRLYGDFEQLKDNIYQCKRKGMKYVFLYFIEVFTFSSHANYILIDLDAMTAYRLDPQISAKEFYYSKSQTYKPELHHMTRRSHTRVLKGHRTKCTVDPKTMAGPYLESQLEYIFRECFKIKYTGLIPCYYNLQSEVEQLQNLSQKTLIKAGLRKNTIKMIKTMSLTGGLCVFWSIYIANLAMKTHENPDDIVKKLLLKEGSIGARIGKINQNTPMIGIDSTINYRRIHIAANILKDLNKTVLNGTHKIVKDTIKSLGNEYSECVKIIYLFGLVENHHLDGMWQRDEILESADDICYRVLKPALWKAAIKQGQHKRASAI